MTDPVIGFAGHVWPCPRFYASSAPRAVCDCGKEPKPERPVTRLSVNLAPTVAEALKDYAATRGVSLTEATRQAIALLKLANTTRVGGGRLMVVHGHGEDAEYREVLLP